MSDAGRPRSGGIAAYARALGPAALALLSQGGFAVAVMALDRANRVLPSNLGYVILVESLLAASILTLFAVRLARLRRGVRAALASPLNAESPRGLPGGLDESWRRLYEATKDAARAELAAKDARSAADLDDFLESVHALKTPLTALSLMADRAEASGGSLRAADLRLELDQMSLQLDRAMARLRLVDFEKGSRIRAFGAAELARASLRRHRRLFIARSISAEVSGDFSAESDPDWIAFILDQLVSNAAKHAASRVVIEIAAASGRAPSGGSESTGRIEVVDDGPGFDPEEAARAFGRSAAGGRRGGSGPSASGYGLYLAREAALRLGARLEIAGGPGGRVRLSIGLSPRPFRDLTAM